MRSVLRISPSGLASNRTRSAVFPASTVPSESERPKKTVGFKVAARRASEPRNALPVHLDDQATRVLLIHRIRRAMFSPGFFRLSNPVITFLPCTDHYVPYWAGFYGNQQNIDLVVLNGVRQTFEGGKFRRLIQAWLLEEQSRFSSGDKNLLRTFQDQSKT